MTLIDNSPARVFITVPVKPRISPKSAFFNNSYCSSPTTGFCTKTWTRPERSLISAKLIFPERRFVIIRPAIVTSIACSSKSSAVALSYNSCNSAAVCERSKRCPNGSMPASRISAILSRRAIIWSFNDTSWSAIMLPLFLSIICVGISTTDTY